MILAGRNVRIHTPPGYDAEPNRRWPVLYMLDGQNLFDESTAAFGMSWHVERAKLPVLIVGIDCRPGAERFAEYSPWPMVSGFPGLPVEGRAATFAVWLVDELKPAVDAAYRTLPGREHTGMAGSSMGGRFALWAGWKYQQVFSRLGAFSPYLDDDASVPLERLAEHLAGTPLSQPLRLYHNIGGREVAGHWNGANAVEANRQVRDLILATGLPPSAYRYEEHPEAEHNEHFWAATFPSAAEWLWRER